LLFKYKVCWIQNNVTTQQGAFVYSRPLRKLTKKNKIKHSSLLYWSRKHQRTLGIEIIQSARRSSNICQCECFHLESNHKLAKVRKLDFTTWIQFSKNKKIVTLIFCHILLSHPWKEEMSLVICVWIETTYYCKYNYGKPMHRIQHNKG